MHQIDDELIYQGNIGHCDMEPATHGLDRQEHTRGVSGVLQCGFGSDWVLRWALPLSTTAGSPELWVQPSFISTIWWFALGRPMMERCKNGKVCAVKRSFAALIDSAALCRQHAPNNRKTMSLQLPYHRPSYIQPRLPKIPFRLTTTLGT